MKSYLLPGLFLGLVFCTNLKTEIIIDGVLDENLIEMDEAELDAVHLLCFGR